MVYRLHAKMDAGKSKNCEVVAARKQAMSRRFMVTELKLLR